jgi:hypothetical protein
MDEMNLRTLMAYLEELATFYSCSGMSCLSTFSELLSLCLVHPASVPITPWSPFSVTDSMRWNLRRLWDHFRETAWSDALTHKWLDPSAFCFSLSPSSPLRKTTPRSLLYPHLNSISLSCGNCYELVSSLGDSFAVLWSYARREFNGNLMICTFDTVLSWR